MSSPDDEAIVDDELVYRRVLDRPDMVGFDENLNRFAPLSAAVRFDPDGMSVSLHSVLVTGGVGPAEVAAERQGSVLFSVRAREPRSLQLGVIHTPAGLPEEPVAYAHGSIVGDPDWGDKALRERRNGLRPLFVLAWGEITVQR